MPWQGYFIAIAKEGWIDLAFDCYGLGDMKCARLYIVNENVWEGYDYDGRFVTLEKVMKFEYCADSDAAVITEAGDDGGCIVIY